MKPKGAAVFDLASMAGFSSHGTRCTHTAASAVAAAQEMTEPLALPISGAAHEALEEPWSRVGAFEVRGREAKLEVFAPPSA